MSNDTSIVKANGAAIQPTADMPEQVFALYQQALAQGEAGAAALEKLVELQDRIQRRNAELQFSLALAEFQETCPPIQKSSTAKIVTSKGGGYSFTYADLEEIITTVRPHCARYGFSFTFDSKADGKVLTCVCTLRHANGHRESSSFTLPIENGSGASDQQKVGGALTYAKRQCLISVLGLALTDPEPETKAVTAKVSDEQRASILALLDETKVAPARFCERFKISTVADLPASLYSEAVRLLEAKRKEKAL